MSAPPPVPKRETVPLKRSTPPPPPMPQPMEQVIPPDNGQPFYRNPKELRANMPPNTLQAGVYQGGENTPMI